MDIRTPDLRNMFVLPAWLFNLVKKHTIVADIYCPDDRFYFLDNNGNVHSFVYQGKNLAGLKADA